MPVSATDARFAAEFGDRFFEAWWPLHSDAAISAGYYAVADRLIVPDADSRNTERRFLETWIAKLHEFTPEFLGGAHRTDWAVLDNELRARLWQLNEERAWEWDPSQYNVARSFALLLTTEYAPLEERLRTVLERLRNVPAYYAAALASIQNPTREHVQLAIAQNRSALDTFGTDLEKQIASSRLSAQEHTTFHKRIAAAREAIQRYVSALEDIGRTRVASGEVRAFRLGRELYERKFAFANAGAMSAEDLYRSALEEKSRVLEKMASLADELWPKILGLAPKPADHCEKISAVIDRLSAHHVAPERFVPYARELIPQLEKWVMDHDLVTLDPTKPLVVRNTPAYQRGVTLASIDAPGPYNPGARTYFNVMPLQTVAPEQAESFLREYNDWVSQILIIHESVPGHYVQLIHANRSPSRIKSLFGSGVMIEGWAVYTERMMLESGWGADQPELWLMYWKWYLRSVVNTVLDYGVHVMNMSEQEALHLMTHEAFQDEKEAAVKWRRTQLSSVQLTSYFSGFSQVYALRERLRREQGSGFSLKAFHDRFLSYGSAPIPLIVELMTS